MHSEQCNLSRRDVRHSLTHKREGGKEEEGWMEGGRQGGGGGGSGGGRRRGGRGGCFLIEFPDNAEINLTPVKFDYISSAVAPPTHTHTHSSLLPARVSSLALAAFVSPVCRQTCSDRSSRASEARNPEIIFAAVLESRVRPPAAIFGRPDKEYYLSFCLTVCSELSWAHPTSPSPRRGESREGGLFS